MIGESEFLWKKRQNCGKFRDNMFLSWFMPIDWSLPPRTTVVLTLFVYYIHI